MASGESSRPSIALAKAFPILAVALFSMASVKPQPVLAATAGLLGSALLGWSIWRVAGSGIAHLERWGAGAALAVIAVSLGPQIGPLPATITKNQTISFILFAGAAGAAFMTRQSHRWRLISVALGLLGLVVATAGFIGAEWESDLGIDVYHVHRAAGEAIVHGLNPYTDAVQIPNGSPYADEGAVIEGYPYPPVVLLTYGLVSTATDPRIISTVAWFVVIATLAWSSLVRGRNSDRSFAVFLVIVSMPVWPAVWYTSWTEPLSVVLFLLAWLLWDRSAVSSGVLLGLALASKQYLIFLLPLLLLHREAGHRKRVAIAISVAATSLLPFLIADPSAFVSSTVLNLSEIGFRPDSQSIPGLLHAVGINGMAPTWLWLVFGFLVATWLARASVNRGGFAARAALTLGLVFLAGLSFPNYWFLVATLAGLAAAMGEVGPSRSRTQEGRIST